MKRSWLLIWYALLLVLISPACSVTIAQTPPATTSPTGMSLTLASLTGIPAQRNKIGNPLLPTTTIPVTWANLNLTGKLIYISAIHQSNGNPLLSIQALDLGTGLVTTIFQGPDVSWIYYVSVSPDEKQLVMAYSSPPQGQSASNPLLYIMPLDGSTQPQLLVLPPTIYDQYIQAEWSPDGKYIYYVHNNYQNQPVTQHYPTYEIWRMAYPGGQQIGRAHV